MMVDDDDDDYDDDDDDDDVELVMMMMMMKMIATTMKTDLLVAVAEVIVFAFCMSCFILSKCEAMKGSLRISEADGRSDGSFVNIF